MNPALISITLIIATVSLVLSQIYVLLFGYDLMSIPINVVLVAILSLTYLSFIQFLLSAIPNRIIARTIATACIFIALFMYLSVYLASYLSSFFWSQPMYDSLLFNSYSLLIEYYIGYFGNIMDVFLIVLGFMEVQHKISFLLRSLTLGLIAIVPLAIGLLWASRAVVSKIVSSEESSYPLKKSVQYLTVFVALSIFVKYGLVQVYAQKQWRGEPVIDTFFSGSHLPYSEPYREFLAKGDREVFDSLTLGQPNGQNVILIIVDALRGNYLTDSEHPPPFITKMINNKQFQSVDFVYSACSYSTCGIMSILASKNINRLNANNVKLQEVLGKAGYTTHSIMAGYPDWYGMKTIYEHTYDYYIDSDISGHETHHDDIIIDELPKFSLEKNQPFFLYLRLMSTHEYGRLLNKYMKVSRYEYANRVLQADYYLEKIFTILESKGVLENSTIIITGDHGHSQGEKLEYGHNQSLYHNQLHVPVFIYDQKRKYPELDFMSSLDVAPTLVDRVGITPPSFWDGISMFRNKNEDRMVYHSKAGARYQTDRMRAITYKKGDKLYKFIYTGARHFSASQKRYELYELRSDPEEENNLVNFVDPDLLAELRNAYAEHFRD